MYRILFLSKNASWPYIVYDVDNPWYGNASNSIIELCTEELSMGAELWPEWANHQGETLFTFDINDLYSLQITHPELFI